MIKLKMRYPKETFNGGVLYSVEVDVLKILLDSEEALSTQSIIDKCQCIPFLKYTYYHKSSAVKKALLFLVFRELINFEIRKERIIGKYNRVNIKYYTINIEKCNEFFKFKREVNVAEGI